MINSVLGYFYLGLLVFFKASVFVASSFNIYLFFKCHLHSLFKLEISSDLVKAQP
jgi:hypothetical protein